MNIKAPNNIHVFFLVDTSMSMRKEKISSTNQVLSHIVESLSLFKKDNSEYNLYVYDILYSNYARWGSAVKPTAIEIYSLPSFSLSGFSNLGEALKLANDELIKIDPSEKKFLITISDGSITDNCATIIQKIYSVSNVCNYAILIGQNEKLKSFSLIELVHNIDNIYKATEHDNFCNKLITQIQYASVVNDSLEIDNNPSTEQDNALEDIDNKAVWED